MTRFSETHRRRDLRARTATSAGARVYFDVDDINAATPSVRELGGEAGEALPVPGMGWFSVYKDTEGNEFGLWQNDPTQHADRLGSSEAAGGAALGAARRRSPRAERCC